MPENVFIEARSEGVGQLVTEEAEIVGVEGCANAGAYLPQHLAEHVHKLTLISDLHSKPAAKFVAEWARHMVMTYQGVQGSLQQALAAL